MSIDKLNVRDCIFKEKQFKKPNFYIQISLYFAKNVILHCPSPLEYALKYKSLRRRSQNSPFIIPLKSMCK